MLKLVTSVNLSSDVLAALATRVPEVLERRLKEPGRQAQALALDVLVSGDCANALEAAGWQSAVEIPLTAKGTVFGALLLFAAGRHGSHTRAARLVVGSRATR